jgi:large subunit ribosomal protein L22
MEFKAQAKYIRVSPRKARMVIDLIRGKSVDDARNTLKFCQRAVSEVIFRTLNSAVANAENKQRVNSSSLSVVKAYVDEGPTIKRFRPRAKGSASRINKRTCHITIYVGNNTKAGA